MSRRYGRVCCPVCRTWYGLDEDHTCPSTTAVLRAAFPGPVRPAPTYTDHFDAEAA